MEVSKELPAGDRAITQFDQLSKSVIGRSGQFRLTEALQHDSTESFLDNRIHAPRDMQLVPMIDIVLQRFPGDTRQPVVFQTAKDQSTTIVGLRVKTWQGELLLQSLPDVRCETNSEFVSQKGPARSVIDRRGNWRRAEEQRLSEYVIPHLPVESLAESKFSGEADEAG
jgi:hypothetical protein